MYMESYGLNQFCLYALIGITDYTCWKVSPHTSLIWSLLGGLSPHESALPLGSPLLTPDWPAPCWKVSPHTSLRFPLEVLSSHQTDLPLVGKSLPTPVCSTPCWKSFPKTSLTLLEGVAPHTSLFFLTSLRTFQVFLCYVWFCGNSSSLM